MEFRKEQAQSTLGINVSRFDSKMLGTFALSNPGPLTFVLPSSRSKLAYDDGGRPDLQVPGERAGIPAPRAELVQALGGSLVV